MTTSRSAIARSTSVNASCESTQRLTFSTWGSFRNPLQQRAIDDQPGLLSSALHHHRQCRSSANLFDCAQKVAVSRVEVIRDPALKTREARTHRHFSHRCFQVFVCWTSANSSMRTGTVSTAMRITRSRRARALRRLTLGRQRLAPETRLELRCASLLVLSGAQGGRTAPSVPRHTRHPQASAPEPDPRRWPRDLDPRR